MARKRSPKRKSRYRSSITGRYVSEHYAKRHPKTTQRESR